MAKKEKQEKTTRKTKVKWADLPTQQMTKAEVAVAKQYWNEYGADVFMPLFGWIVIIAVGTYVIAQQEALTPKQYESGTVTIVAFVTITLVLVARFYYVVQDMGKRQTVRIEGVFTKKGEVTHRYSQYLSQQIDGYSLIFPPKTYHNLEKGDYVVLHCTRFLRIVVDYQIVERAINDSKK